MGGNRRSNNKAKLGHCVSSRAAPPHSISATPLEGVQARDAKFATDWVLIRGV